MSLAASQSRSPEPASLVALTPLQRDTIYRTIVEAPLRPRAVATERVPPAAAAAAAPPPPVAVVAPDLPSAAPAEFTVGTRLPAAVSLHAIPPGAVAAVPAVGRYRYAFIGDRVLLVDPDTGIVVAAIGQ